MRKKLISALLFGALGTVSMASSAAITTATKVDFDDMPVGLFGHPGQVGGSCDNVALVGCELVSGNGVVYSEGGMIVGTVDDPSRTGEHVHLAGTAVDTLTSTGTVASKKLHYHGDSAGIYLRAADESAFKLTSMIFRSPFKEENPVYNSSGVVVSYTDEETGLFVSNAGQLGANEYWEIFGFADALNSNLTINDGHSTAVAYQTVANGFSSTNSNPLVLNEQFANVKAVWIHYKGYPIVPTNGKAFDMTVDNIIVDAPVSNVPVPGAVWLFGTGMLGLFSFGRKKAAFTA